MIEFIRQVGLPLRSGLRSGYCDISRGQYGQVTEANCSQERTRWPFGSRCKVESNGDWLCWSVRQNQQTDFKEGTDKIFKIGTGGLDAMKTYMGLS
jgi:hypothetical protein